MHFSRVAIGNLHPAHLLQKASFLHGLSCISGFYTFPGRPFWRMRSAPSVECWYALSTCLAGQKGRMRFFLNIFRIKRKRPFWPTASLSKYCRFSCALKASPIYLLKTVSCNSEFLSHSLRCLTSIYFWTIIIIYNPAGLWFAVPLSSIFKLTLLGSWPQNRRTASGPILVPWSGWAFG